MTDTTMNTGAASLSDEQIDVIANAGCRNAAGGIYATSVYEFARAIEAEVLASLDTLAPRADATTNELASITRMFHAACADLGAINEALGLDPDDGGAEPILEAIAELRAAIAARGAQEPVAWVRYRSDGGFEGPIMDTDARMCDTRRSFWTPLYAAPLPRVAATALTIQAVRTLLIRHAESYSEWDDGSIERIDFGQYGFGKFARALLARQPAAIDKEAVAEYRRGVKEAFHLANMINANRQGRTAEETCSYLVGSLATLANGGEAPAAPSVEQDERGSDEDDYQPTPESERAAFNAMMRWHLIRLLQAWRYGGDLRAVGMAAFEWARSNDVGKEAFKASEKAVKLAASTSANVAQGAEAVAWREEAQKLFTRCKLWPEKSDDGFMALLELRNHVEKLLKNDALTAPPAQTAIADATRDAIRRAALEDAAKVCDSVNNFDNPMTARDCADAIRALSQKDPQ